MHRHARLFLALLPTITFAARAHAGVSVGHTEVGWSGQLTIGADVNPYAPTDELDVRYTEAMSPGGNVVIAGPGSYGADLQVSDGVDCSAPWDWTTMGSATAHTGVAVSWSADATTGAVELDNRVAVDLHARYIDDFLVPDGVTAVCPYTEYQVATTAIYDASLDTAFNTALTIDAPATITLSWAGAEGDVGYVLVGSGTGMTSFESLVGSGSRAFALPAGTYALGMRGAAHPTGRSASGELVTAERVGVALTWAITFAPPVETTCERLGDVADAVIAADLAHGLTVALSAKLHAAEPLLCNGTTTDDGGARGPLLAFRNQVLAQRGKKISTAVADALLAVLAELEAALP